MSQCEMLQIPHLLKPFIDECSLNWPVQETKLNCESCPMVERGVFRPHLKCCTFQPHLMNFQVGYVLEHNPQLLPPDLDGNGLGLKPSVHYQERYRKTRFGWDASLRCSFHTGGQCAIWDARPSSCVSYFCESRYGARGLRFWEALGEMLHELEMSLAQEALLAHGFTWPEVERCLQGIPEWAHWQNPHELFRSTYRWLQALSPTEIEGLKQKAQAGLEMAYLALEESPGSDYNPESHELTNTPTTNRR